MARRRAAHSAAGRRHPRRGVVRALALTAASAVVWGIAHLRAGRRITGFVLLGAYTALAAGVGVLFACFRADLKQIAVQPSWLAWITVGMVVLAVVWGAVVVHSYQVVWPPGRPAAQRFGAGALVILLAGVLCTPILWLARDTYTLRNMLDSIFPDGAVDAANPWKGRQRLNVLLLGGDGAADRSGVRTDSVTLASIDTRTGDVVLLSLPRNLQRFPMPARLRDRWPDGFTGYPGDQGLLNELYQDAEDHPDLEPGYPNGRRGPQLMKEVVSSILGQPVDYYVLVNLFGFADIVDAVGGVRVHVTKPLPIGGDDDGRPPTGWLTPGYHTLMGSDALWYARSRHADSDYARMARQKCLLKAITDQVDPRTLLTRFQQIAAAAKRTISTDVPGDLLPPLVRLSERARHGARMRSLMFVPPLVGPTPYRPDVSRIRRLTADALRPEVAARAAPSGDLTRRTPEPSPTAAEGRAGLESLDELCR